MRHQITLRHKIVGESQPLFIIAECGVTCNYDMSIAKSLIDVVRDSGADAIKFIFWFPDEIMSDRTISYQYETVDGTRSENMYEMLNALRFSLDQWRELKAYADARGVIMFCTVNSPGGIEYAEAIGLEAYKLSSWDYNYLPLWRRVAALNKPIIIDTGPVTTVEVATVLQIMKDAGNDQCVLVHCFHTDKPAEMNMRTIPYLRNAFDCVVGFSATDTSDECDLMAIALGAQVLEKRLTMDRRLPGHHHVLSKEPKEFAQYVATMRVAQAALGTEMLTPSPGDLSERTRGFRHLVANCDIPVGTVLTPEMIEGKRPEAGLSPAYFELFVGRTTRRPLKYNQALSWDDV